MGTREGEQVTVTSDKDHPHAYGDKSIAIALSVKY